MGKSSFKFNSRKFERELGRGINRTLSNINRKAKPIKIPIECSDPFDLSPKTTNNYYGDVRNEGIIVNGDMDSSNIVSANKFIGDISYSEQDIETIKAIYGDMSDGERREFQQLSKELGQGDNLEAVGKKHENLLNKFPALRTIIPHLISLISECGIRALFEAIK